MAFDPSPFAGVAAFDADDTLLRDKEPHFKPIAAIVALFRALQAHNIAVHVITARLRDAETTAWTQEQLQTLGIVLRPHCLHLAPAEARTDMASVAQWKRDTRVAIARKTGAPMLLSVGDQWGDIVALQKEEDIDMLDARFAPHGGPYFILRPRDHIALWGLKLRDFH